VLLQVGFRLGGVPLEFDGHPILGRLARQATLGDARAKTTGLRRLQLA
jgi:hypothetical protein